MLKVGNKIRFGHQIFIVECIKNNNILLNNNNILNWFSFDDIKKNCQKIQFNKPQNLSESFCPVPESKHPIPDFPAGYDTISGTVPSFSSALYGFPFPPISHPLIQGSDQRLPLCVAGVRS